MNIRKNRRITYKDNDIFNTTFEESVGASNERQLAKKRESIMIIVKIQGGKYDHLYIAV